MSLYIYQLAYLPFNASDEKVFYFRNPEDRADFLHVILKSNYICKPSKRVVFLLYMPVTNCSIISTKADDFSHLTVKSSNFICTHKIMSLHEFDLLSEAVEYSKELISPE